MIWYMYTGGSIYSNILIVLKSCVKPLVERTGLSSKCVHNIQNGSTPFTHQFHTRINRINNCHTEGLPHWRSATLKVCHTEGLMKIDNIHNDPEEQNKSQRLANIWNMQVVQTCTNGMFTILNVHKGKRNGSFNNYDPLFFV